MGRKWLNLYRPYGPNFHSHGVTFPPASIHYADVANRNLTLPVTLNLTHTLNLILDLTQILILRWYDPLAMIIKSLWYNAKLNFT